MNEDMKNATKETAEKYAMHYAQEFISKAEDKKISFEEHYKSLNFKKEFFYELLYEERPFQEFMSEKRRELYYQIPNEKELDLAVDELEKELIKETNKYYKKFYTESYLEQINEKLEEYEEERNYAIEDEDYYENRKYVNETDDIGGNVSEEERNSMIVEMKKKQKQYELRIENLENIKKQIQIFHIKNEEKMKTSITD